MNRTLQLSKGVKRNGESAVKKSIMKLLKNILVFTSIILIIFTLPGCKQKVVDVNEVKYIEYVGDFPVINMLVITSDLNVKYYNIRVLDTFDYDLLADELPPENWYDLTETEITQDDWDRLVNAINQNDFMSLPEQLPYTTQPYDHPWYNIQVKTNSDTHDVGGYAIETEKDEANKRFIMIQDVIEDIFNINE